MFRELSCSLSKEKIISEIQLLTYRTFCTKKTATQAVITWVKKTFLSFLGLENSIESNQLFFEEFSVIPSGKF